MKQVSVGYSQEMMGLVLGSSLMKFSPTLPFTHIFFPLELSVFLDHLVPVLSISF
jgi:hypothetical protein